MKKSALFAFLTMMGSAVNALDYRAEPNGPFIVISRQGGFSGNSTVSIRKSAVISAQLEARRVVITTSAIEVVRDSRVGNDEKLERSVSYAFDNSTDSDAKSLYDFIMRELGSDH